MYQCPITYFKDNLIFNIDGSCWACYKFYGYNYDLLSSAGKIDKLVRLSRLFGGIFSEAMVLIIPIEQNLKEHFSELRKRVRENDTLADTAKHLIDLTEDYLQKKTVQSGLVNDYSTYIVVKLEESAEYELVENFMEGLQYFLKDPINAINVKMNLDTKDILQSKIASCTKRAERWHYENNGKIEMKQTSSEETQWLFRRMAYRGTGEATTLFYKTTEKGEWEPRAEEVTVGKENIIKPYHKDTINLFSGTITQEGRALKVDNGFTNSYQTFLTLSNIPDEIPFPGKEWIYMLQKENLHAEICIHMKVTPHKSALNKVEAKRREIKSQSEHIVKAGAKMPEDLSMADEYADILERELKDYKAPLLNTSVTICLADKSPEALERKCSTVKGLYEEINFAIERPLTDQLKLFFACIPSVGHTIRDFILPLTPMTLASGIMGVTRELGDWRGNYIGTTGEEEKPAFFAPELACLLNMSPAITFFGDLGVGKSFNANLVIYHMVMMGGYGLIIDPKGERSHWVTDLTSLRGLISIVTLGTDGEDKGRLDPYNIFPDSLSEANEMAMNVLSDMFALDPKGDENTILIECQQKMSRKAGKNCMLKLAEMLDEVPKDDGYYEVAHKLARKIRSQRENGMAGLLIGDGTETAIRIENRLNIIQLQNLKMPDPNSSKEDYSRDEVLSSIIFGQISAFVKKFAMVKRPVPKAVLIDESWFVSMTKQGRNMEEFISRMGRSLFTVIMYNGHSVRDLPTDGIRNSITYKFVFRCKNNEEEAKRLLEYIGLEVTDENMSTIQNLRSGECLFKDLYNRVGVLRFDAVFQDLIDVFSTTPKEDAEPETSKGRAPAEAEFVEPEELSDIEELPDLEELPETEEFTESSEGEEDAGFSEEDFDFNFEDEMLFQREEL